MLEKLNEIYKKALADIEECNGIEGLQNVRNT